MFKPYLIDGTFELFRSYFGAPSAKAPDGREVGAVRGIARSLLALLRSESVSHAGAAFDTVIESFRNQMFAGYKTGEGLPDDLVAQFPLAEEAAAALGLVVWPMIEFEADDAIASAAALAAADPRVDQVVIASPDKDFAQCVRGQRVICLDRMRSRTMDEDGVARRFGIGPASIPDYLALVGDDADGIPGLRGWGARSASAVLARYGHIEDIPSDPGQWEVTVRSARNLAATLAAARPAALLYRQLATLRTDAPLGIETVDDLAWRGARRDLLEPLCQRLGDGELVGLVHRWRG
ncbi:MAG TPA: 5'-3' exonuclease H3TH domain-containing protein [Kofleriaceae bacterium]|nr:5'-3' exonuclease H3TH domain-containing protein [Kofleriaceae bacterium]